MTGFIRYTPTDADSGSSAIFYNKTGKAVATLLAVASGECPFIDENGARWPHCKIVTDIPIPDGYRQAISDDIRCGATVENFLTTAKWWNSETHEWESCSKLMDSGRQHRCDLLSSFFMLSSFFVIPIESEATMYRPFATREEWWPHRHRWVRNGEKVTNTVWISPEAAKSSFDTGCVFLNDDGTDAEPFGTK